MVLSFFYKAPHSRSCMLAFKLLYKERREIRRHQLNQTGVNLERSSKSPDIIFSTPSDQIFFGQFSWEGVTIRWLLYTICLAAKNVLSE